MTSFVYSPAYYCDIGSHVFPVVKFRMLYERLRSDRELRDAVFLAPDPLSRADLELVHTPAYVDDILACKTTTRTMRSELPISEEIIRAYLVGSGGTVLAAQKALETGGAMNLTGGFHHCFPDHAEGFCYVNDVAVAAKKLQVTGAVKKAAVIDCDLHQGNGTAFIFRDDPTVFTFSIHQENNYPIKQQSDVDVGLRDGTGDDEYLEHLRLNIPPILSEFKPGVVFYLAGADPYAEDQLGGLRLTMDGLKRRDEYVIGECLRRGIRVAVVVAGGYAFDTDDTVQIHHNTSRVLHAALRRFGRPQCRAD